MIPDSKKEEELLLWQFRKQHVRPPLRCREAHNLMSILSRVLSVDLVIERKYRGALPSRDHHALNLQSSTLRTRRGAPPLAVPETTCQTSTLTETGFQFKDFDAMKFTTRMLECH